MQSTLSSLTLIDTHTQNPKAFWNGRQIPILEVFCHSPKGEDAIVKLKVIESTPDLDADYAAMLSAGIKIKIVKGE